MTAPHAHRVQVLVAGMPFPAPAIRHDPTPYQRELREAKARFGSVLCNCQVPPLKLVVRERESKLFLAAWPDQASKHSLDCPFFSEQRAGAEEYAPGAIERVDDVTHLALAHQLRQARHVVPDQRPRDGLPPISVQASQAGTRKTKLHLWGLLHHLWEEAGLNRWYPGWHRDWGFTRYALRRAAQATIVERAPLLSSLYIPPVWNPKKRDEIQQHWNQYIAPLLSQHRRMPIVASGFVLGTLRSLEPSEFGHVIKLHHHSERFYIDAATADLLARFSRRGWAAAKRLEAPHAEGEKPYVVAAMRVEASHTGRMTVVEAALMRVSPRFIPVNSSYEDKLARLLVEGERRFVRPLHYDNHSLQLPDFVLKDAAARDDAGRPTTEVALYVYGASIPPAQLPRIVSADRAWSLQRGIAYWQWNAAEQPEPPALPEIS